MSHSAVMLTLFGAIALTLLILFLVSRRHLTPGQSVLWLTLSTIILFFGIFPNLFFKLSTFVGAQSAVSTMTFLALIFFAGYSLYLSSRIAVLEKRIERIAITQSISSSSELSIHQTKADKTLD